MRVKTYPLLVYPDFEISHSGGMGSVAPALAKSEAFAGEMARKPVEQT